MTEPAIDFDPVLAAAGPRLPMERLLEVAETVFGVRAAGVRDLGSERDLSVALLDHGEQPLAILKVSNAAEDVATLDMEALAVLHAARVDPGLPLAIPRERVDADAASAGLPDPARRRAPVAAADGGLHHARLYDVLPGRGRADAASLDGAALVSWGETAARLDRALRGFFHPAAQRTMLWDVQHAARSRALIPTIRDAGQRELVERVLDRYDAVVAPIWPSLRAQVVHGDLTIDNALVDDAGLITGIVDFGDMSHSALVTELASVLDSFVGDRGVDGLFLAARRILDGYQRVTPLEAGELRIMGELLAARAAITIAISSWRTSQGLEDAEFAERYNGQVAVTMGTLLDLGWDEVARRMGADVEPPPSMTGVWAERRGEALGPALEPLSYRQPVHVSTAQGAWITTVDGERLLDAYNNVPCVGHAHPRVVEAIARQARRINTNLRYLHSAAVELAERLADSCPAGLDTVLFVNSGSEANDLAWRLATSWTGAGGGLCTDFAYHGISAAIAPFSPETWPRGQQPDHVETFAPPDRLRGLGLDGTPFAAALSALEARGHGLAATILDGVLTSDGFAPADAPLVAGWLAATHDAGGLWIADEVQGGHGRSGTGLWSFERFGIVPDIVTLGKPMGNGHPVGAVITRREIAQRFADETVFFSTFGGNPVAAAAGLAVLDVLADEELVARAAETGDHLRAAIREVAAAEPRVVDVRGVGLAIGIELADPQSLAPDAETTTAIKEGMRDRGVLIGTCGAGGNVLKVRPPLAFTEAEIPIFAEALAATLAAR